MIISHTHRFVFFSNPKTGSESVRQMLLPYADEVVADYRKRTRARPFYAHMPPSEAEISFADVGWNFQEYETLTCVRNPFPRLVSLYEMIGQVDRLARLQDRFFRRGSFTDWLVGSRPDGHGGGGWRHQRWRRFGAWSAQNWLHAPDGRCLVNHAIPLERLHQDLPILLARLGLPGNLRIPHANQRVKNDYRSYYTQNAVDLVHHRYAWDLKKFNYSFGKLPD